MLKTKYISKSVLTIQFSSYVNIFNCLNLQFRQKDKGLHIIKAWRKNRLWSSAEIRTLRQSLIQTRHKQKEKIMPSNKKLSKKGNCFIPCLNSKQSGSELLLTVAYDLGI